MNSSIVEYFMALTKIDSESRNEKKIADKLKNDLEKLGAEVEIDNTEKKTGSNIGNLYAYFPGNIQKKPILFCAHLDTVPPGNNIKPQIVDGKIVSDGTTILGADDKSGIAEIIWAIKELQEEKVEIAPIELLFTVCEEIGLLGAKNVEFDRLKSEFGFAMDSHIIGEVTIGAPSQNSMTFIIHGKEAHAGANPEEGINAIKIAADAIAEMKIGRIDYETTCNIGCIEGGQATNIVPNKVMIKAEARSHNAEKLEKVTDNIKKAFEESVKKHQGRMDAEIIVEYNAFRLDEKDEIVRLAAQACKSLNFPVNIDVGGGGSDANILNAHGLKVAITGTGMSKYHTVNENISIEDLQKGVKWVKEMIKIYSKNTLQSN